MTLRKKTLIAISITLICLIIFLYAASSVVVLSGFSHVEDQDTRKNVQRVQEALSDELYVLNGVVGDWAAWNETYTFVNGEYPNFVEEQIADRTFIEIRLNMMLFINSTGGVVYGSGFDLQNQRAEPVPEGIRKYLSADSILLRHKDTQSNITGIILLPEGPMLIASRPILTNERMGPIRGSVIWGRYLNNEEVKALSTKTHLSVTVHRLDDALLPSDFLSARESFSEQNEILVRPLNGESIAGYTVLRDIYGAPALILRADMPRDIYKQGQASVNFYLITMIVVGMIFSVMFLWLLEKLVLSRLFRLNADVLGIGRSGDLSKQLLMEGKDELSSLAGAINTMTGELKTHRDHLEELVDERTKELRTINQQLQQEITERRKADEALKDSEERYRTIIEHSNDLIWTLDTEGRFVFFNNYAEKVSGYRLKDWAGRSFAPLINKEDLPGIIEKFNNALKGQPQEYEVSVNRQDGSVFILSANSAPIYSKGEIIGVVSIGRDITESKKAEEIRLENARLASASRAKSEFLANMSHELRTPLNSIIGFSELLKQTKTKEAITEKQEHYVDNIITSGRFLLDLINDILDLSKVEAGKIELIIEKLSVPAVINETFSLIKERAAKHNIELKKELDPQLDFIEADQQRIKQILFNLLSNAVKFNKEGGIVTVTAKKEGDMARISVSDTGIGIKEEDIGKLFKEFEQVDSGISRSYGGTGLGLAISKKLVELHGGKITAMSKYGEGTTFTFLIPISQKAPFSFKN